MRRGKKGGKTVSAPKKNNAKDEDWKEICRDCDILIKGNNCFYGCEIIKAALRREEKEESSHR